MCNAVILNLLESLLISQYYAALSPYNAAAFLPLFSSVAETGLLRRHLFALSRAALPACELNALLLRLLHESITSLFIGSDIASCST